MKKGIQELRFVDPRKIRKLREIKKELLYDIHDELGGILTKTSMRVELISLKNTVTAEEKIKYLGQINSAIINRNLRDDVSDNMSNIADKMTC